MSKDDVISIMKDSHLNEKKQVVIKLFLSIKDE